MEQIYNFFFNYQSSTLFLGIYRILILSTLLIFLTYNLKGILLFIDPSGVCPDSEFKKRRSGRNFNLLFLSNKIYYRNSLLALMYLFGIFSLIGFYTNISLIIFYIIYLSFQKRAECLLSTGGDVIINVILLCLILTQGSGLKLSIDSLFSTNIPDYTIGWPLRLLQITISFGFFQAGLCKLCYRCWWEGKALKQALFTENAKNNIFTRLIFKYTFLNKNLNYITIFYQFLSPLLLWSPELCLYGIIIGVWLHFGMALTLHIGCFGFVTIIALLSFANNYFL